MMILMEEQDIPLILPCISCSKFKKCQELYVNNYKETDLRFMAREFIQYKCRQLGLYLPSNSDLKRVKKYKIFHDYFKGR